MIKDDLVFTPTQSTPEYENLDLTSTLSPSLQYAVRQLIHRELDVLKATGSLSLSMNESFKPLKLMQNRRTNAHIA